MAFDGEEQNWGRREVGKGPAQPYTPPLLILVVLLLGLIYTGTAGFALFFCFAKAHGLSGRMESPNEIWAFLAAIVPGAWLTTMAMEGVQTRHYLKWKEKNGG